MAGTDGGIGRLVGGPSGPIDQVLGVEIGWQVPGAEIGWQVLGSKPAGDLRLQFDLAGRTVVVDDVVVGETWQVCVNERDPNVFTSLPGDLAGSGARFPRGDPRRSLLDGGRSTP